MGETLAPFKVPAHVEVRADLPYTDTGKVLEQDLERQELESRQRAPSAGFRHRPDDHMTTTTTPTASPIMKPGRTEKGD